MLRFSACACGIFIVFIVLSGCQSTTPTFPPEEPNTAGQVGGVENTRVLFGAYTISMKPGDADATVEPVSRELLVHFDVTGWVTPPACNDCLKVQLIGWQPQDEYIDVMVTFKNPMELTGYDIRAVVRDYDLKEFIDPEGYTDRWSDVAREPFYCFAIENPDRMFGPFETYCRHVAINFPPGSTWKATILVDASWPGQAKDPYEVKTHTTGWLINDGDEDINIVAYVYDHQEDIEYVHLNLMPFGGPYMTPMYDDGDHNDGEADDGIFCAEDITATVPPGDYDLWVSCKSAGTDLMTHQKVRVKVSDVNPYGGNPDYDRMYDDTQVKRLDITVDPGDWEDMQVNLLEQMELPWDERDFLYVECTVEFEGFTWEHVGIRYKGNSTIQMPVQQNRKKLPFRLDFDEFEDEYPETQNQRIWGLKWMVFGNNYNDPTMLREKITYDLHRQTGIAASRVAHYRLFIDHGEGTIYFGLYTSPDVVDKRFLEDRFGDDTGNLYKPEGPGGNLTVFVQDTFEKKTNEEEADFSDIINFIDVLNANYANPWEFRTAIEQEFDVGSFLDWLAVNSVLCNLDSYAGMSHNYYLYNDPGTGLFHFIPWDLNLSFGTFKGTLNADTMPEWDILHPIDKGYKPLIIRILWVPAYMDAYKLKVRSLLDGPLLDDNIHPRIDFLHELARPYVIGPEGEQMPYTVLNNPNDFDINIDDDIPPFGPKRILGLKSFLADRRAYIDTIIP